MQGGTLTNASSSSNTDAGADVGGAIGYMGAGTVTKVSASGNAMANVDESSGKSGRNVGGFVGQLAGGTITDSYATGTVTTDYTPAGGFVGYMYGGSIDRSYSTGAVTANDAAQADIAGFVGEFYTFDLSTSISNSFTASVVNAPDSVGAFGGYVENDAGASAHPLVNVYYDAAKSTKNYCFGQGTFGSGDGELYSPNDITADSSGNFYVVDNSNNRVEKFDSSGTYLAQWGTAGTGDGQFSNPYAVATDPSSNVYVVDLNNSRVQKFDSSGNYLTQWGSYGAGNGEFGNPTGIATDSSSNVYVVDGTRVQKFDSSGNYLTQWGSYGAGNGQFASPGGIAVDSLNNIYVVDAGNSRVEKFDSSGSYLTQWGTNGTGNGEFAGPTGIATDSSGNAYVVDTGNSRVEKFDSSGSYLTQWGSNGAGDGQFSNPQGVTTDSSGNVYVVDSYNNRVEKFDSSGAYLSQFGARPTFSDTGCTKINVANSDPSYFFNAAHEPFATGWDSSNVWYFSGSNYPTLLPVDQDNDGISNIIENGAPNNGDGNNDGILDSTQSNVASWVNSATGKYVTLVVPSGVAITAAANTTPGTDSSYDYPLGLAGFTITGVANGGTTTITLLYHDSDTDSTAFTPRKYFPSTNSYLSIPGATVTNTTIAYTPVVQLSYQLTDGSNLDLDGAANGSITDPVGLGTAKSELAPTGQDQLAIFAAGFGLVIAGAFISRRSHIKRYWTLITNSRQ